MKLGIIGTKSEYFCVHNSANETFGSEATKNSLNGSSNSPLNDKLSVMANFLKDSKGVYF